MSKRIIFVAGLVASGKTTFSQKLACEAGVPCFNKDSVKSVLSRTFDIDSREQSKRFSEATFELLRHIAEQLMKADASLILESNFRITEAEQMRKLCEQYQYQPLTYLLTADIKVLHQRFIEREYSSMREKANKMYGLLDKFDDFRDAMISYSLMDVDFGGRQITVDTSCYAQLNYESLLSVGLEYLKV